jgi:hypothetical protein
MENLKHYFVKESTQLDSGGDGYKETSFTISKDKLEIHDIVDDYWGNGFEYEFHRTITIASNNFQSIIDCINKLYRDNSTLFDAICLAYEHGGIENIVTILDKNNIPYDNNVYSKQN